MDSAVGGQFDLKLSGEDLAIITLALRMFADQLERASKKGPDVVRRAYAVELAKVIFLHSRVTTKESKV